MSWYEASETPEIVDFGPVGGLAVTGEGAPGGPVFTRSVQVLFSVAGPLLGMAAQAGAGFPMPVLEGRWWVEDDRPALEVPREEWHWHLFLRLPDGLDPALIDQAQTAAASLDAAAHRVQYVTFTEGKCVQLLHNGSYDQEPASLALMADLMEREGLSWRGPHHEIYLSDQPGAMRTILRQPVA